MKTTFQFNTENDKQKILSDNPTLTLIEEQYLVNGNFIILSDNPVADTKVEITTIIPQDKLDLLKTADEKYKELDLTTASLADVQNAKTAQIRELYNQTLASGFSATVSGMPYTFGWQTDDITHMNAAQTSVSKGFLLFPILYADVHGMPVSIPDQATLDNIQSIATKFMMAQHQQALNLVGQVQSATTNTAVNAINWSPATY